MLKRIVLTLGFFILLGCSDLGLNAHIRLAITPADDSQALPLTSPDILIIKELTWLSIVAGQASGIPLGSQPILLRIVLPSDDLAIGDSDLDKLEFFLRQSPGISCIILKLSHSGPIPSQMNLLLKQVSSLIKGLKEDLVIGLEATDPDPFIDFILNQKLSSYIDAMIVSSSEDLIQEQIMTRLPELRLWERINSSKGSLTESAAAVNSLLSRPLFMSNTTSLYLFETAVTSECQQVLARLMPYLNMGLIDRLETVDLIEEKGFFRPLSLYFKTDGVSPVIIAAIDEAGKKTIRLTAGVYENALITNLRTGAKNIEKIGKHTHNFKLSLQPSLYVIELTPRESLKRQIVEVGVSSQRQLNAEEIVAKARAWMTMQSRKLHSFIADMSVAYGLKVGNLNETFDLLIRGPYFSARGEPSDWVQEEFFLNRIKWKSKKTPKIPLLQPDKVNIAPLEIDLNEHYQYQRSADDMILGTPVFVIHFKPGPDMENQNAYEGKLWIRKQDGAVIKKELTQLRLKGEVISNVETQFLSPCSINKDIWLTTRLIGHQIFNIAGTLTHIEKRIEYSNIRINPSDFELLRKSARESDSRMVRDTVKGLRYLVKDPKSGQRMVEWQQSKAQTAAIFGCFYDSSYAFPVPLAGINYLNFDIGGKGKGRQVNILFGGAMLLANYADPSLFGSGISLGANFNGIAFASKNKIFRDLILSPGETLREQVFKSYISLGFSLSSNIKVTTLFAADYSFYSRHKEDTAAEFIVPESNLTTGLRLKLDANFKGFNLSWWGEHGHRSKWDFWGNPGNDDYRPAQKNFFRWRIIAGKDFKISLFRKLQTKLTLLGGQRLDRFSAYKFGYFSELRISGFNSGSIRAEKALMLNLAYAYQLGQNFGLEFKYDSVLIGNKKESTQLQYFSGLAVSASTALPLWDNMLIKFEAGIPVICHGIKGFVLNLMLLKMF